MTTDRAQPITIPPLPDLTGQKLDLSTQAKRVPTPKRAKQDTDRYLLRMPVWLKELVALAAQTEGISMNSWLQRVVSEAGKNSANVGWRTIPVGDSPRALPQPVVTTAGVVHAPLTVPNNAPAPLIPQPTTVSAPRINWDSTSGQPIHSKITYTPGGGKKSVTLQYPDADIPELS